MRVLVTRPEPAATRSAARLTEWGHQVLVAPLMAIEPCAWAPPDERADALIVTSANAFAGGLPATLARLPILAIGDASAQAARAAGARNVQAVNADRIERLYAAALAAGHRSVLHLAGRDHRAPPPPPGLRVELRIAYAARLQPLDAAAAAALREARLDVALLYSARAAARFAHELGRLGIGRARLRLALIAPRLLPAVGGGWAGVDVAARPDEAALFAAAGLSCENGPRV